MVDCLRGRALLLSLTELSGPRLESRFFVNSDSPGMLALFWDSSVRLPDNLCSRLVGQLLFHRVYTTNFDGRRLLPLLLL